MMLNEAARVNGCNVQEATQFLVDFAQGNLCDWSNEGFPMCDVEEDAHKAQIKELTELLDIAMKRSPTRN